MKKPQPTGNILAAIGDPSVTRPDFAEFYADCIMAGVEDWHTINLALLGRYARSSLIWIKSRAWRIVKDRRTTKSTADPLALRELRELRKGKP